MICLTCSQRNVMRCHVTDHDDSRLRFMRMSRYLSSWGADIPFAHLDDASMLANNIALTVRARNNFSFNFSRLEVEGELENSFNRQQRPKLIRIFLVKIILLKALFKQQFTVIRQMAPLIEAGNT